MNLWWALGASIVVSLISFIGVVSLILKEKYLNSILILLVGLGAGGLIGGAFLHLLPEALEKSTDFSHTFFFTIAGFTCFFILEKYFYWRHCHKGKCEFHAFTYLNLVGDAVHNLIDGLIIGASFTIDVNVGMVTTIAIVLHEIPQELGDFGVLLYGGWGKAKALFYNFLSATTAILGTLLGYYFSSQISGLSGLLLPFAAGGFIYIAACDLIPELHRQPDQKKAAWSMLFFLLGIGMMALLKMSHHH
ncbi:MAG: ZIP family metal transporter [Candidatus Omnitrophica bacterium]|nr:ZIP family metal transporter [Candidatus Omnitrophota bacterium]